MKSGIFLLGWNLLGSSRAPLVRAEAASRAGASRKVLVVSLVSPSSDLGSHRGRSSPSQDRDHSWDVSEFPFSLVWSLSQLPSVCGEICSQEQVPGDPSLTTFLCSCQCFVLVLCSWKVLSVSGDSMGMWHRESGSLFPP